MKQKRLRYYRKFSDDRNKFLETIFNKYRVMIADQLRPAFAHIARSYNHGMKVDPKTDFNILTPARHIQGLVVQLRQVVGVFTVISEGELLARVTEKPMHVLKGSALKRSVDELEAGGHVYDRVIYYIGNICRKLDAKFELAKLHGSPLTQEEIIGCFPKLIKIKKKPILQRIKEAEQPLNKNVDMVTSDITDEEWDKILEDYMDEYVPRNRGPELSFTDEEMISGGRFPSGRYEDATYQWELEQDISHDFVQTVRDGQNESANENGLTDFVWVAVVDSKTDDCCLWRDGLTTKEIEQELKGEHRGDEYDGITPALHFGCRCSLEPATDDLPDIPQSNAGEFEAWLNDE